MACYMCIIDLLLLLLEGWLYLYQGGYFRGIGLSVCLHVCLSVRKITQSYEHIFMKL